MLKPRVFTQPVLIDKNGKLIEARNKLIGITATYLLMDFDEIRNPEKIKEAIRLKEMHIRTDAAYVTNYLDIHLLEKVESRKVENVLDLKQEEKFLLSQHAAANSGFLSYAEAMKFFSFRKREEKIDHIESRLRKYFDDVFSKPDEFIENVEKHSIGSWFVMQNEIKKDTVVDSLNNVFKQMPDELSTVILNSGHMFVIYNKYNKNLIDSSLTGNSETSPNSACIFLHPSIIKAGDKSPFYEVLEAAAINYLGVTNFKKLDSMISETATKLRNAYVPDGFMRTIIRYQDNLDKDKTPG